MKDIFASGGRDGQLFTYDLRFNQGSGSNPNAGYIPVVDGYLIDSGKEEIEAFTGICFYSDEKTLLTTQSGCNGVKLWDTRLSTGKPKKKNIKNPSPNPANVMIIDKTLPLQCKINDIIEEINVFKENRVKTKESLKKLW
jgi:WD40 repeat protein